MSKQKYPNTTVSTSADGTKSVHKGREHYSHAKADARKDRRREQAEDRQIKYDTLSLAEKLAALPKGTCQRQRAKLEKKLAAAPAPVKKTVKKVVKKS